MTAGERKMHRSTTGEGTQFDLRMRRRRFLWKRRRRRRREKRDVIKSVM